MAAVTGGGERSCAGLRERIPRLAACDAGGCPNVFAFRSSPNPCSRYCWRGCITSVWSERTVLLASGAGAGNAGVARESPALSSLMIVYRIWDLIALPTCTC